MEWVNVEDELPEQKGFYYVIAESDSNGRFNWGCWFDGEIWRFDNEGTMGRPLYKSTVFIAPTQWLKSI